MNLNTIQTFRSIEGFLLTLGIGLLPIYVFSSGGIQPAHAVLALFALLILLKRGVPFTAWLLFLLGISFYSLFLESFYVFIGGGPSLLMSSVFFFYSLIVVASVYSYCRYYGLSALTPGVLVASAIALFAVGVVGVSFQEPVEGRSTGTFNNPNQLGYFSVCILSLTYLLYSHRHLRYTVAVSMFAVAVFLSVVSLSKAAMISNFVVAFFALKPVKEYRPLNNKTLSKTGLFWLVAVVGAIVAIIFSYLQGAFDQFLFFQRLQGITQEADSSLESRGYFAFLEGNFIEIFFGLGSNGVGEIVGHEVHSTLASVLNNYGFIGFFLFSGALVVWAL